MRLDDLWASLFRASLPPAPGLAASLCSCGREFAIRFFQLRLTATPCGFATVAVLGPALGEDERFPHGLQQVIAYEQQENIQSQQQDPGAFTRPHVGQRGQRSFREVLAFGIRRFTLSHDAPPWCD